MPCAVSLTRSNLAVPPPVPLAGAPAVRPNRLDRLGGASSMIDHYAPPAGSIECPYCQTVTLGAPQPSDAIDLISFSACCPVCTRRWTEMRTPSLNTRYWRDPEVSRLRAGPLAHRALRAL